MKAIIYVEGKSDKLSMEVLLEHLITQKLSHGIVIEFYESAAGDRKKTLLTKIPLRAANIIINNPDTSVAVIPDLHPPNKGFEHRTFYEMKAGILHNFDKALNDRGISDIRLKDRFHVFCFKHDLEVLILASPDSLKAHLGVSTLGVQWKVPVEDQNHDCPPKRIVEDIFARHGRRYHETVDAPMILRAGSYQDIAGKCPQCFKPFVDYLSDLRANV